MENESVADEMIRTVSKLQESNLRLNTNGTVTNRRQSIVYFNELKMKEDKKDQPEEDKDEDDYETMKLKIQIMNKDEVSNQINDFIFSRDPENRGKLSNENMFTKTRYANNNAFPSFFEKYRMSDKLTRKGIAISTPSFNLIKSLKENYMVPNPVGLVKRDGIDSSMNLK
jgi:hypothetical protein